MRTACKVLGIVVLVCFVNILTLGLFMKGAIRAGAGATQPASCPPGDVNGDDRTTVADAIYLLGYMFEGGPTPVACAGIEPQDIRSEMESALARFMPRAEDNVYINQYRSTDDEADVLVEVPDGKVFMLTYLSAGGGTGSWGLAKNGESIYGLLVGATAKMPFVAGDQLQLTNSNPGTTAGTFVVVGGYYLDASQ